MTTGRKSTHCALLLSLIWSALFALWSIAAQGAPSIAAQIGFNGHVVPERYAPLRMRVRGYEEGGRARAVVTQPLGNEWRDTATVRQELDFVVTSDGSYSTTIPIYEPLNPIGIALIDEVGRTVAETEVDLRAGRHLDAFPLLYGSYPYPSPADSPSVTAAELPPAWWAYDAVQSLWISSPPPQAAWAAIAQWVIAGGSVVLVSGPDYFRFDSPVLRVILPLADPSIETAADGLRYLDGSLRSGAFAYLSRGEFPLLVGWPYGAGHVAVVAVRPGDLTEAELDQILTTIPVSSRISTAELTEELLGAFPVVRPTHSAALLLIAASVVGFSGVVAVRRRYRRAGEIGTAGLFIVLGVLSGLYANTTIRISNVYAVITNFELAMSFGIDIDTLSFYSPDARSLAYSIGSETIPAQAPPAALEPHPIYALMPQPTATPWIYHHFARAGHVVTSAAEIGQKTFYCLASSPVPLRLTYDPATRLAVLDNQAAESLAECWLIVDGSGVRVPPVPRGVHTVSLPTEAPLSSLLAEASEPSSTVLRYLANEMPLQEGVWFIALSDVRNEVSKETGQKVRHLDIYVVKEAVR